MHRHAGIPGVPLWNLVVSYGVEVGAPRRSAALLLIRHPDWFAGGHGCVASWPSPQLSW